MTTGTAPYPVLRGTAVLAVAAAAIALGTALAAQYLGGLQPCVLCVWQRYPYGAVIALALLALFVPSAGARRILLALAALAFLTTAGIAVFHVGVEQGWWQGTAGCGGGVSGAGLSLEELEKQLMATPVVRCTDIAWSLGGISMAAFNAIYALLCGIAVLAAVLARRKPRP